ncbi:transcriptional regulator [Staphylococcus equorum]|uniref:response regulator n=1 Tax=Staphylococcus TaxID=1279 RepID=UPI000396668F|nr:MULTISPECIES: response regulator [Staphylococcus]ANK38635.1 DNA-binding transcriptional activator DcuR [Staphylococcus sp. AntiMn-1]ERH35128.1 transcriptional regulator [Staphylococcus equorum UMC-CNS-924]MCZ4236817.1 response regulator [Staphylococcus equorum]MDK9868511.1 response regulator [Staphylococcus equorum]MEB7674991.1 response regulator [Staphylococcus equorum]
MLNILIVEDDPMVAQINQQFIKKIDDQTSVDIVSNVKEAIKHIENKEIDLLLLDIYMPEENGLTFLKYIREQGYKIDAILITAATDVEEIQTAFRYGAVDYLIKPFDFERFQQSLLRYKKGLTFFNKTSSINQTDIDAEFLNKEVVDRDSELKLPKGVTEATLQVIIDKMKYFEENEFSTDDISKRVNISRVSVRKYLKFLTDIEVLEESLNYGIGRPINFYKVKKDNLQYLKGYIEL